MTNSKPQPQVVTGDRPIDDPSADVLGYAPFAQHLAESICAMAPAEGFVVSIYGCCGAGKTTLLRFIEHYRRQKPKKEQPAIVHFNPWWFSGHEDLTRHFLGQLRSTLSRWKTIGEDVLGRIGDLADVL